MLERDKTPSLSWGRSVRWGVTSLLGSLLGDEVQRETGGGRGRPSSLAVIHRQGVSPEGT